MKKRSLIVTAVVVIGVAAAALYFSKPTTTTTNYVTEPAKKGEIELLVSASGNINPENIYNVNPRTSAKVVEVNVKMGDVVSAGQQLAKLDDTDLQNALKTANYNFNAAIYTRDQLKKAPVVDDLAVKKAQQQVNSTSVQVDQAKTNLNNAKILAPIAGKVLAVNIKVGEYASISAVQPAIIVGNSETLQAYININEVDIDQVKLDQKAKLTIDALDKTVTGKVISIDETGTNTAGIIYYKVRTNIDDTAGMKPGMSVTADLVVNSKSDALIVPAAAVQTKNGKSIVRTTSVDANKVVTAVEKEVTTGLNNNTYVEITSGLSEGEAVIINYNVQTTTSGFSFGGSSN